jgi:hypothetical protein
MSSMTAAQRRRIWRLGTVLPAVFTAVVGLTSAAVMAMHSPSVRPANFTDRAPLGILESLYQHPGGVRAIGWDFDPDAATAAVRTYATVDHKWINTTDANLPRADIAKIHPHAGPNHGFSWSIPVPEGTHLVCIVAKNIKAGADFVLGCRTMTLDYGPFGAVESLRKGLGTVSIRGWAVDSDRVAAPVTVVVKVDATSHTIVADDPRPDIADVRKGAGPDHGYAATYSVSQGRHTVCVTAKNIGFGTDNALGCKSVILNESPVGAVDTVSRLTNKVHVRGWAYDPDAPTQALTIRMTVDGVLQTLTANLARKDVATAHPAAGQYHGFDKLLALAEGTHTVCLVARNVSFGSDLSLGCRTAVLAFTPKAYVAPLTATSIGLRLTGWAYDPDTTAFISARISLDGRAVKTLTADRAGATHGNHNFALSLATKSGKHTVCVVGINVLYGTANSAPACQGITLALEPIGAFESLKRQTGSTNLAVLGWALDPDTTAPLTIAASLDGATYPSLTASATRTDIGTAYPTSGAGHGIAAVIPADDGEHKLCLRAVNVGGGTGDTSLGCKVINAVHPLPPSAPQNVTAIGGYGAATVSWTAPASDGGAPWTKYVVTSNPSGLTASVGATMQTATVSGLASNTTYTFTVQAVNVAGTSVSGRSPAVTTENTPPPQTTPAPVSTSRYIRNVRGSTSTDLAVMRAEGAADATANPSGHGYLVLLDIGGQDQVNGGVILSATTRFISYGDLVRDVNAYLDGYHSKQRSSAPVTVAIGTNNDIDVSAASGKVWATKVINPVRSYAARYTGIRIAGANDIEPGFRATYTQTKSWMSGYLAGTTAPFVFNGSADGCAWTVINRGCNNGWTMSGLYYLAAGAAPVRMLNLPQIYNTTMAGQWKYISLTGIAAGQPRIRFGGPLTEWTACAQTNSCGSLTGKTAWSVMWTNLQSDSRLKVSSLPYSTDLRIDR